MSKKIISHRERGTVVLVDDSYFFVPKDQNEDEEEQDMLEFI